MATECVFWGGGAEPWAASQLAQVATRAVITIAWAAMRPRATPLPPRCRRTQQIDDMLRLFPGCKAINPDRSVLCSAWANWSMTDLRSRDDA